MRVASAASRVRVRATLAACCCFAFACTRGASDVSVSWTIDPSPASAGAATLVRFDVKREDGKPVGGAKLRVEAHMTHPGMQPLVAELIERATGTYEARLNLPMAGRWILVVSGTLADGRRIEKQAEVTAVQPSG